MCARFIIPGLIADKDGARSRSRFNVDNKIPMKPSRKTCFHSVIIPDSSPPPPPLSFLLLFSILWTLIRGAYVGGRTHHAAYGTCQKLALQQCPRSGGPLAEVNRSTAGLQGPVRQFSTGLLRIAREISHPMAWNPCARSVRLIEFFHFLFLGNDNVLPPIFQPFNRT